MIQFKLYDLGSKFASINVIKEKRKNEYIIASIDIILLHYWSSTNNGSSLYATEKFLR